MPDGLGPALGEPLFERVALIGVGLIGSSLAHVIRRKGLAREIAVFDASPEVRRRLHELSLADHVAEVGG